MLDRAQKKINVRFSKQLKSEMLNALVQSGYGLRGKSKWMIDTIQLFLKQSNFAALAEMGINANQAELTESEAFLIDHTTIKTIDDASIDIKKQYPLFNGVQSALIRSAVIYRLELGK